MNILVTDPNYKHSLGLVRYFSRSGARVFVLSTQRMSLCSWSKYCFKELKCCSYFDSDFNRQFLSLLNKYKIELVVPVGASAHWKLSSFKRQIQKFAQIVIPEQKKVECCLSKKSVYEIASQLQIPIPKTWYPEKLGNIEAITHDLTYPCVIKPIHEGKGVVAYARSRDDLVTFFSKKHYREKTRPVHEYLIQEFISGFGCGFFALYKDGVCGPIFQHKRIREMPKTGGVSVAAESYCNPDILKYGKRILDHLCWHGVAMVEFKMRLDNTPVLIEINPKFWGSLDLALEAGADFTGEIIKIAQEQNIEFRNRYMLPFRYHWPLNGDMATLLRYPQLAAEIIKDFLDPKVKSNLWLLDDPLPAVRMLLTFVISLFTPNFWIKGQQL